jgi:hypothetical protein
MNIRQPILWSNIARSIKQVSWKKYGILFPESKHRPLKHGSVRSLGWSVGVKVPGIQITPAEARKGERLQYSAYEVYIDSINKCNKKSDLNHPNWVLQCI